jgi:hypothetical protein
MTILKGGFNYFSLISVILFSNQDHLCDTLIQTVENLVCWYEKNGTRKNLFGSEMAIP